MSGDDSTDSVRQVKPFRIELLTMYPKVYLDEMLNLNDQHWKIWHKRGLKPLNMNKKDLRYLGRSLLECWETEGEDE